MHGNKWLLKHYNPKPMGFSKISVKKEVQNNKSLPQTTSKHPKKILTIPKATRKRTKTTTTKICKVSRREKS